MIDYESKESQAALKLALSRKTTHLRDIQVLDFILFSKGSLWYTQAKKWSETPPKQILEGLSRDNWKTACKLICEVVESGYDAEKDQWWTKLSENKTKEQIMFDTVILSDFGFMLDKYRHNSLDIVSAGFDVFLDIVLGKFWKRRYNKFLKQMAKK